MPAEPFSNVQYYAPYKPDGYNLNTLRTNEALSDNVEPLVWGLEQILKFAEVLLTREDVDAKADALIEFIRERIIGREFGREQGTMHAHLVRTFQDLEAWFEDVLAVCEQNDQRGLADASRRDDPQSAQPPAQPVHARQGPGRPTMRR